MVRCLYRGTCHLFYNYLRSKRILRRLAGNGVLFVAQPFIIVIRINQLKGVLSKTALPLKHYSRIRASKTLVIIKNANLIAKLTVFFDSIRNFRVFPSTVPCFSFLKGF